MKVVQKVQVSSIKKDCFTLPEKDDDTFVETYESYLDTIGNYFVDTWIPDLKKKKVNLSSAKQTAIIEIQKRVSEMWDKHLGV